MSLEAELKSKVDLVIKTVETGIADLKQLLEEAEKVVPSDVASEIDKVENAVSGEHTEAPSGVASTTNSGIV